MNVKVYFRNEYNFKMSIQITLIQLRKYPKPKKYILLHCITII